MSEPQDSATETAPSFETDANKPQAKKKKSVETAIRFTRVSKKFGHKAAVDDLSLSIPSGKIYGLIGPNGAGKTTTFSMMAGYLAPTSGGVDILGFDTRNLEALRGRVGVLPQDAMLPPLDRVGEFLVHLARLQDLSHAHALSAARTALQDVGGGDWWDMRCSTLSHGMAKRVALAQALLGDPDVVLLDEPSAGLDPRVAHDMRQLVKSLKGKCTVVISSHNLQELEEVCDGAAILDHGKLIAHGTIAQLTASSEEVHIKIGRVPRGQQAPGEAPLPIDQLRSMTGIARIEYDEDRRDLGLFFDRAQTDAETVIGQSLWTLLSAKVRIAGVTKGRGLEARVMDLTDD